MLRAGIIGLGTMGQKYIRLITTDPRCKLVGVADKDEKKVSAVVQAYGVAGETDIDAFLKHALDFVYIGTPDFAHTGIAIKAAERGISLLIEKPLAMSVVEAKEIADAVKRNGVLAQVCFYNRRNPPFIVAKQAVEAGKVGSVVSVYARLSDSIVVPTQMLKWADKTTVGWFLMSHTADLAQWFINSKPVKVVAAGVKGVLCDKFGINTYDSIHSIVFYENGAIAVLESSWILPPSFPLIIDFVFNVIGTNGCIQVTTTDQMVRLAAEKYEHLRSIDFQHEGELFGQVALNYNAFVKALIEKRQPSPSIEDGVVNTAVLEAIHRSIEKCGELSEVNI